MKRKLCYLKKCITGNRHKLECVFFSQFVSCRNYCFIVSTGLTLIKQKQVAPE